MALHRCDSCRFVFEGPAPAQAEAPEGRDAPEAVVSCPQCGNDAAPLDKLDAVPRPARATHKTQKLQTISLPPPLNRRS